MSHATDAPQGVLAESRDYRPMLPQSTLGWVAAVFALLGLASFFVLPLITTLFRETYPITDTFVIIMVVLVDLAAALNAAAVIRHERSVTNLVALVLTAASGAFVTFIVVGEGLGGA